MSEEPTLNYSPNTILLLFVAALMIWLLWTLLMVILAWDVSHWRRGQFLEFAAPFLALWFALLVVDAAIIFRRHWSKILTVTSEGIHPRRLTLRVIPWSAIDRLKVAWTYYSGKGIRMSLKDEWKLADFGVASVLPHWLLGRSRSTSTFLIASGLNAPIGRIANEINKFPQKPEGLFVE